MKNMKIAFIILITFFIVFAGLTVVFEFVGKDNDNTVLFSGEESIEEIVEYINYMIYEIPLKNNNTYNDNVLGFNKDIFNNKEMSYQDKLGRSLYYNLDQSKDYSSKGIINTCINIDIVKNTYNKFYGEELNNFDDYNGSDSCMSFSFKKNMYCSLYKSLNCSYGSVLKYKAQTLIDNFVINEDNDVVVNFYYLNYNKNNEYYYDINDSKVITLDNDNVNLKDVYKKVPKYKFIFGIDDYGNYYLKHVDNSEI